MFDGLVDKVLDRVEVQFKTLNKQMTDLVGLLKETNVLLKEQNAMMNGTKGGIVKG